MFEAFAVHQTMELPCEVDVARSSWRGPDAGTALSISRHLAAHTVRDEHDLCYGNKFFPPWTRYPLLSVFH